ncbi:MAG: lysophospholipid acyltransferase family protein [Gammaproteobacteria bacterium]
MSKHYSRFNLLIRSAIFSVFSVIFIITASISAALAFWLPISVRFKIITGYLRFYMVVLKHLCHIDYHVEGLDNIPKEQRVVVLCKHQSTWETFFMPLIFRDVAMIAKRELLWVPFFGWGFAASEPITINRNNKSSAMQQIIKKGAACLKADRDIIAFPEGTRVPVGVVGNYRLGAARLIAATQAPFICVAHNAGSYWPRRQFIKRPGTIQVVISPLMSSVGKKPEQILESAKGWIENTMARMDA